MSLATRLKQWRQARGMTQLEFSQAIGLPLRTLKGYELDERAPGTDALVAISQTGCNLHWLLTGVGEMDAQNLSNTSTCEHSQEAKTRALLAQIEQVHPLSARLALLDDLIARAQTAAEISTLRAAVAQLQKHLPPPDNEEEIDEENED